MSKGDAELDRGERARQGGIDVAHDQDYIGPALGEDGLQAKHDLRDLRGGRGRLHPEIDVRVGQLEVGEEAVRHRPVVVLTGMDQERAGLGSRAELGHDGRDLYEVRAGPDDGGDLQCASPALSTPACSSTSRAGPNRKSLRRRCSLASVLPVLILWRTRVIRPTRTLGWCGSISHGCIYTMAGCFSSLLR